MKTVLPVASGKGGVGKSLFSSNLGVCLAQAGKTVVVVDLDLGGSNLHTFLGVPNSNAGIGRYIYDKNIRLEQLIVSTEQKKLFLIPGDSLLPGTANLPYFRKVKLVKELGGLVADYVILDLGSGSSYNTVDFFLAAAGGIVVCSPETTSILNAYSFLKSVLFRVLHRSFPPGSEERRIIYDFLTSRIEGSETSLASLISRLGSHNPESGKAASEATRFVMPRVVLNMGRSNRDIAIGGKLREVVRKNLNIDVSYIGFLPYESLVGESILKRTPLSVSHPNSPYVQNMRSVANRLISEPVPEHPHFFEDEEDLETLRQFVPNSEA